MGTCSVCGDDNVLTRSCNHCGREVCTNHTLPEKHDCPAVTHYGEGTKHLQSDIDAKLSNDDERDTDEQTSPQDSRIAHDRTGVTKDKRSKTPLEEYRNREQADENDDTSHDDSDNDETDNSSVNPRKPSDLPPRPNKPRSATDKTADNRNSSPDMGPDVAPDGSLIEKDSQLDRELDNLRQQAEARETGSEQNLRLTLRIWALRTVLAVTSVRVWVVVIVAVASAGQLGLAPVPGFPVTDDQVDGIFGDTPGAALNESRTTSITDGVEGSRTTSVEPSTTASSTHGGTLTDRKLNRTKIELLVHREINDRRKVNDQPLLEFDTRLQQIARSHSKDMATEEYFAHTSPSGEDFVDRYREFGYSCEVRINSSYTTDGAENIAYTYAFTDVTGPNGATVYHDDEQDIAEGLVNQWMNSTGHREIILKQYWNREGIGIYTTKAEGRTKVYATQNFC